MITLSFNPSKRKQLYAVLIEYPVGSFYKFLEARNEKEAKEKVTNWLTRYFPKELRGEIYIADIKLISSLKEVLRLKGLTLDED